MNDGNYHYYYTPQEPPRKEKKISAAGIIGIIIASAFALVIIGGSAIGGIWLLRSVSAFSSKVPSQETEAPSTEDNRQEFNLPDFFYNLPFGSNGDSSGSNSGDKNVPSSPALPSYTLPADTVPAPEKADYVDLSSLIKTGGSSSVLTNPEIFVKGAPSTVGIVVSTAEGGMGVGSGIVLTENGYILTNHHVISDANTVTVLMYDGSSYGAVILGSDETADVAVLQINAKGLTPAAFADSARVEVGEAAVAIGTPLDLDLSFTMTSGIVSAANRKMTLFNQRTTVIQTDVPINSGNSGGPLFNSRGEVMGVVFAKETSSAFSGTATIEGIGYAIPANTALEIAKDIALHGHVTGRPYLGITIQPQYQMKDGHYTYCVVISEVVKDGPADKAGFKVGDVILSFNGIDIAVNQDLLDARDECKAGDTVPVVILRSGKEKTIQLTLGES